jgi:hypothetical protein
MFRLCFNINVSVRGPVGQQQAGVGKKMTAVYPLLTVLLDCSASYVVVGKSKIFVITSELRSLERLLEEEGSPLAIS